MSHVERAMGRGISVPCSISIHIPLPSLIYLMLKDHILSDRLPDETQALALFHNAIANYRSPLRQHYSCTTAAASPLLGQLVMCCYAKLPSRWLWRVLGTTLSPAVPGQATATVVLQELDHVQSRPTS